MSKTPNLRNLDEAKRIAALMLAMPPQSHDDMKSGRKPKTKAGKSPSKKGKPAKEARR